MIDFTGCKVLVNSYEGADFKRKIIYDGDVYMLKFGQKLESDEHKPLQASYTSTPVSEYLGSHIYALAGLPTQHTVMGTYDGRSVVACRDFIESRPDAENVTLVEFKKLENSFLGSSTAGGRLPFISISPRIGALRCESAACTFTSALASDVRRVSYPSHCNPFHADSLSIRNGSHPSRSFAGLTRGAVSAYCGSRGQSSLSTSSHSKRPLPLLRHWNRPRRRP